MRLGVGGVEDFETEVLGLLRSLMAGLVVAVAGIAIILGVVVGTTLAVML